MSAMPIDIVSTGTVRKINFCNDVSFKIGVLAINASVQNGYQSLIARVIIIPNILNINPL
jgi:hypothetical protein